MVNMPEAQNGGNDLKALNQELAQLDASEVAELIAREIEKETMRQAADDVRRRVDRSIERHGTTPEKFDGSKDDPETAKGKAAAVQRVVRQIMLGARQDKIAAPEGKPPDVKDFAVDAIKKISEAVNPETVTESVAPYLFDILSKLIKGEIEGVDDLSAAFSASANLEQAGNITFQRLQDGLINIAKDKGYTEEDAREKFSKAETPEDARHEARGRAGMTEEERFAEDWGVYYRNFLSEDDMPTVHALYSINGLKDFATLSQNTAKDDFKLRFNRDPDDNNEDDNKVISQLTSEEMERRIVLTFSNLYARVDRQRPNKFFEEIIQEGGFYNSIQAADNQLKNALRLMSEKARRHRDELPDELKNMKFFQRYSIETVGKKEITENIEEGVPKKTLLQYRITPTPGLRGELSLGDFLTSVASEVDHEINVRSYLHNVQAIFLRQPGEGGFWGQMGNYSEQLRSEDIDAMMLLPDSEVFMAAYSLYIKYLEEEFAKANWVHQPNMFATDYFKNDTKIQQLLDRDLRKLFPSLNRGENEWRLRRAMSMGIGISKGVLLSEVEMAAWADPNVAVDKGTPSFVSYYTNDNAALISLNPLHHFLRLQAEGVMKGPLIFLPVENLDQGLMRRWDHTVLWKKLVQYRDSLLKGESAFDGKDAKGKLFTQILPNFARGGSFVTRSGWRMEYATEGWRIYKGETETELDFIKSFKALENIGDEAVATLTGSFGDFLKNASDAEHSEFFSYLYKKYIDPEEHGNFEDYLETCEGEDINEKCSDFLHKAFARMLHQRMPTKMVTLERDRQSSTGVRLWEKIRKDLGTDWTPDRMDDAMRNLKLVEVAVRCDISQKMRDYLSKQPDENKSLAEFEEETGSSYKVTEEEIKKYLSDEDQEDALKLFQKINEEVVQSGYIDGFASKLKNRDFPFAIATEELNMAFLSVRNSGPRTLARALKDTAQIENVVIKGMTEYLDMLLPISISPNHDISKLVGTLKQIKETIEMMHGQELSTKVAHHLASLSIAYFKKDALAKNIFTRPFAMGRPNSLAAEFAGTWRGVWEWEVSDVDTFITELERSRVLPKMGPFDLSYQMGGEPELEERKIFGYSYRKLSHEKKYKYSARKLRENYGATKWDIAVEYMNKYIPFALIFILYAQLSRALKAETGEKR